MHVEAKNINKHFLHTFECIVCYHILTAEINYIFGENIKHKENMSRIYKLCQKPWFRNDK